MDGCRLTFVIDAAPQTLALRLETGDAQTFIPLMLGEPLPTAGSSPPAPSAGPLVVTAPSGSWTVETRTYQVLDVQARPYDATRTTLNIRLALTNHGQGEIKLYGFNVRLLENGTSRAPNPWGNTCDFWVAAGATEDRCRLEFVVANSAADLQVRFLGRLGEEAIAPLEIS